MDITLVVMAAGMGSRFGGLKQAQPVTDDGRGLLDFSVYDAIKAGFNKYPYSTALHAPYRKALFCPLEEGTYPAKHTPL